MADPRSVYATLGAVLLGSLVSVFLSGLVSMQGILYFRMFPADRTRFKFMVSFIWILDLLHTIMICVTNWFYLIENFGSYEISRTIIWSVAGTICVTAILTFIVHGFFAHRILSVSGGNWLITVPIIVLATGRLSFALLTTTKMLTIGTYAEFVDKFTWSFTLGLSLATATDILITAALCWYLNRSRTGFSSMDSVIDSITLYTIENGLLTCITTIVALLCWLTMPGNLIFLALHFAISKLYSNTFLATLNARKVLRSRSHASRDQDPPVLWLEPFTPYRGDSSRRSRREIDQVDTAVHISVEKTIQRDDIELSEMRDAVDSRSSVTSPPLREKSSV